jgi:small-conductance mechanosensitive channel
MLEALFFQYESEAILTVVVVCLILLLGFTLKQSAKRIAKRDELNFVRIRLIFKYIYVLVFFIAVFRLLLIWGVKVTELALVFSSVFAVLGIGLFAIWSVLSNITSGIIVFFSFPYRLGDKIKIHDRDFPTEGITEDIKAFQLHLRTDKHELVTYPDNLILQKLATLLKKDTLLDKSDYGDR